MEKTYGAMLTQMHPQDVIPQLSKNYHQEYHFMTDAVQLAKSSKYMNDSKKEDRRFRKLSNYYADADNQLTSYAPYATSNTLIKMTGDIHKESIAPVDKELEASLKGPKMNEKQLKAYKSRMKKRAKKGGWRNLLFGRYR